jgi:hypothetical protein
MPAVYWRIKLVAGAQYRLDLGQADHGEIGIGDYPAGDRTARTDLGIHYSAGGYCFPPEQFTGDDDQKHEPADHGKKVWDTKIRDTHLIELRMKQT